LHPQHFNAHTELRISPFFERTSTLNKSQEWRPWSGYLSATKYELTHEYEYFAIRTKAALFDITPLCKYIIEGPDSHRFLNYLVTRNVLACKIGFVMYTPWCDENGKQIDDGTVQRLSKEKFRLTSAEPNLEWLLCNSHGFDVSVTDVSHTTAALALQGPNSRCILNAITTDSLNDLTFFQTMNTQIGDIPVSISRTGYTGDLGYEIWMNANDALFIWDRIIEKGKPFGLTPAGLHALDIARIEAGLILLDVDYISSRHAIIENQKSSPFELGLGWTVKFNETDFIGKRALKIENMKHSLWKFIGIEIDWIPLESHFKKIGLPPGLPTVAWRTSTPIYKNKKQIGYATSGCWSPLLKRYIALAHVEAKYSKIGTKLDFELTVEHFRKLTPARVVKTPFFNPVRKRSCPK
jgi:aminomethyltransferase